MIANPVPVETIPMWWLIGRWIMLIVVLFALAIVACFIYCMRKFEKEKEQGKS